MEVKAMNKKKRSDYELIHVASGFERSVHFLYAGSCVLLFLSGFSLMYHNLSFLAAMFGGHFITKYVHNFSGLLFAVSGLFTLVMWFKEGAIFTDDDIKWFMKGGGYLFAKEGIPDQGRFNAGQKLYFVLKATTWVLLSATGVIMWFPYVLGRTLVTLCYPLHIACVAIVAGSVIIHIFLGSLGNPGTIQAMITGKCTRAWARFHHAKWLKEYDQKNGA
jgi:formate dehydrogenase subunit gamma